MPDHQRRKGKKPRSKRAFQPYENTIRVVRAPDPNSPMGRASADDRARFQTEPDLQAFVRPLIPGEFGDVRVASEEVMASATHVYVLRLSPTSLARTRIPITEKQADTFMAEGSPASEHVQAEFEEKSKGLQDDPFLLPQDNQRLSIVAAASGFLTALHDYPSLEHDQEALRIRGLQLVEMNVRIWSEITNDVELYTHLFVSAFVFGYYKLGEATLREASAEERKGILQVVRSMDDPAALFMLDQMIRRRMRDMHVETIYELL